MLVWHFEIYSLSLSPNLSLSIPIHLSFFSVLYLILHPSHVYVFCLSVPSLYVYSSRPALLPAPSSPFIFPSVPYIFYLSFLHLFTCSVILPYATLSVSSNAPSLPYPFAVPFPPLSFSLIFISISFYCSLFLSPDIQEVSSDERWFNYLHDDEDEDDGNEMFLTFR